MLAGVFGLVAVVARRFLAPSESLPRSGPELQWLKGMCAMDGKAPVPSAASGDWISDQILTFQVCMYQSPFIINAQPQFSGEEVALTYGQNVGFGPTKAPSLVGWAQ